MTAQTRYFIAVALASAALTGIVFAQGAATPAPQTPPAGQTPAAPAAPAAGRGRGGRGAAPAQGGAAPARRGGFTQFTRPVASQDVIVRGKSLYQANCASCHADDLRGGSGPNLLRSSATLRDQKGELVSAALAKHTPALTLVADDSNAVAEYIHSVLATSGGQGSPPGRNPTNVTLNVLIGDAAAGQKYFAGGCATCHSVTGDLKGIGSKYTDPRALQNAWVSGQGGAFAAGGGGGRGGGGGGQGTVTLADGSKIDGTIERHDDFLVIVRQADGSRKSWAVTNGFPKVAIKDPNEAHKKMVMELDDPENKTMHDITAYLWTVK